MLGVTCCPRRRRRPRDSSTRSSLPASRRPAPRSWRFGWTSAAHPCIAYAGAKRAAPSGLSSAAQASPWRSWRLQTPKCVSVRWPPSSASATPPHCAAWCGVNRDCPSGSCASVSNSTARPSRSIERLPTLLLASVSWPTPAHNSRSDRLAHRHERLRAERATPPPQTAAPPAPSRPSPPRPRTRRAPRRASWARHRGARPACRARPAAGAMPPSRPSSASRGRGR